MHCYNILDKVQSKFWKGHVITNLLSSMIAYRVDNLVGF